MAVHDLAPAWTGAMILCAEDVQRLTLEKLKMDSDGKTGVNVVLVGACWAVAWVPVTAMEKIGFPPDYER